MIKIKRYSNENKLEWDLFLDMCKNATFLFKRDYMDYHSERFVDHSLMFYDEDKLIALLPLSIHGNEARSHGGLTYGGVISNFKMTILRMLEVFKSLKEYLESQGIRKLLYKKIPDIYCSYPSDEDLYALFVNQAKLVRRDLATTIFLPEKIKFSKGKKWGISKARQAGVVVKEFTNYDYFIECENDLLQKKYDTIAVHSAEELRKLAAFFPENIKMFGGFIQDKFCGGTIIFETDLVAHTQYITTTEQGREIMVLDMVIDHLVSMYSAKKKYFSFGISTDNDGRYLNKGLVAQKEMYGGRGTVHDFYELEMT